ncbi:MAG: nucleotidyltransferase [Pseudomonadota bacterium]|uniref:hypothetical protein n=1 Tax=Thermithiobacillus tepidarius TaxID=929 RepID=UPI00048CBBAE|nr:hypothetical protein [Thermithiobacillus tepidarius]
MNRPPQNSRRLRQLVATEAARIMVEEGIQDFRLAKDKALRHLAISGDSQQVLPSNAEINAEVEIRLRLFQGDRQPVLLRQLREAALQAMDLLADFDPRLVGSVLEGTATEHSDVNLHLFADTPESVAFFLMDRGIDYEIGSQHLRFGNNYRELPSLRFELGPAAIHCVIFAPDEGREAPVSRITGKPMRRARRKQVEALMSAE